MKKSPELEVKVIPIITEYEITKGDVKVVVEVRDHHIHLRHDNRGDGNDNYEFVFKSNKKQETISRWKTIVEVLAKAVEVAEKQL